MRALWSQWRFDTYVDAEYVAFTDIDVVFHSWATEDVLFDAAGRARVFGHCPQTPAEVADAPWRVAEWAVALRFENPRAAVLVRFLG